MPLKVQEKLREMSMQQKLIEEKRKEIELKLKNKITSLNEQQIQNTTEIGKNLTIKEKSVHSSFCFFFSSRY